VYSTDTPTTLSPLQLTPIMSIQRLVLQLFSHQKACTFFGPLINFHIISLAFGILHVLVYSH
jgi:hypothetical protein